MTRWLHWSSWSYPLRTPYTGGVGIQAVVRGRRDHNAIATNQFQAPLQMSETKWPVQPNILARGVAVRGKLGAGVGVGVDVRVGLAFCLSVGVAVTVAVGVGVGLGGSVVWSTVRHSPAPLESVCFPRAIPSLRHRNCYCRLE